MRIQKLFMPALLCAVFAVGHALADSPGDRFARHNPSLINNVPPTSYWGLRGLTQTVSAEPLGAGRMNYALSMAYFKQEQDIFKVVGVGDTIHGTPGKGTSVVPVRGAISWGVNDNFDIFGLLSGFLLSRPDGGGTLFSSGTLMGGAQYSLPIPPDLAVRLAFQINFVYGVRSGKGYNNPDEITYNPDYLREGGSADDDDPKRTYAGYDFFWAQKLDQHDVVLKMPVSVVAGNLRRAVKLHINPGIAVTPGIDEWLLLAAAGIQIDVTEYLTFGLAEINWRSRWDSDNYLADPLWLTHSLMFRSPYSGSGLVGISVALGADYRVSKRVKGQTYPLEGWRAFGDIVVSFDLHASKRAEMDRQTRASAAEKARLARQAQMTAAQRDSIAQRAKADSLEMSQRAHAVADSLAALMDDQRARARQDSIAAAEREAQLLTSSEQQRAADSLAQFELQRKLDEERTKRSEQERHMLTAGMLVLDAVTFETGSAKLHRNSRPYLTTIAKMLVKYPKLRIEIGGHTDNTGRFEQNMAISQQRSDAVFSFMVSIEPALSGMLSTRGYGPTMPVANNNTRAGRETNRRVELRILNPEALKEYNNP